MGLLDDAIREHLELKRRHGGDAGEIARLENEVLGGEDAGAPAAAATPVAEAPPVAPEPVPEVPVEQAAAYEPAPAPEPAYEPEPEPEPAYEPASDVGLFHDAEPDPEPELPFEHEPQPPAPPADDTQATVAFSLEELQAAEGAHAPAAGPDDEAGDGEHDELEETPEFLQETPEHDRMWFEQKPPRDFDF